MERKSKVRTRTEMISIRLTPEELERLREKSDKERLSLTRLLISYALGENENEKEEGKK